MTKRTRYFMAGSAAIIVAGLTTGLIAFKLGGPALFASRSGPAELSYVPVDASVVAFANVREVMDSQLRQQLKQSLPIAAHDEGQKEFEERTGIDIERDIDHVVAAFTGSGPSDHNGLVVARGRFNTTQLETLAREHGGVVEEYKGKRLVTVTEHRDDRAPSSYDVRPPHAMTLAFLEPDLVGIGSEQAIKTAIDAQLSAHSITSNDEMMELVSQIDAGNNAWAVGRFDAIASHARLPQDIQNRMPAIKTFAVMAHVDGGLSGTLRAEARDDQSAENLRQVINGMLALGRMQGQNDPKVAAMMQSLQTSGTGKTVALSFAVPAELFQMLPRVRDGHPAELPKELHERH
ncbi:MAG TPA: hypothetical protein VNR64_20570 [Vicinamibacterales bacterium]|nr:hypothetical protein [Vicinamibacterales bacterium]